MTALCRSDESNSDCDSRASRTSVCLKDLDLVAEARHLGSTSVRNDQRSSYCGVPPTVQNNMALDGRCWLRKWNPFHRYIERGTECEEGHARGGPSEKDQGAQYW